MATSGSPLQPVIIKRVKKVGHTAHGGAWKIAYADFVTAMMAFFLLLWLLNATTEAERRGISDHFNQPLMVTLFGGPGSGGSVTILPGGGEDISRTTGEVAQAVVVPQVVNPIPSLPPADDEARLREQARLLERERIEALRGKIDSVISANTRLSEYRDQIRIEMVQDGLNIQIVDEQNRAMFAGGSALVQPDMREILREIGTTLAEIDNRIAISGHTDATPFGAGPRGYSNWELSADRANATRRELVAVGLPDAQLARVVGVGYRQPLLADRPLDPMNRRISILVLTREAEQRLSEGYRLEPSPPTPPSPPGQAAIQTPENRQP